MLKQGPPSHTLEHTTPEPLIDPRTPSLHPITFTLYNLHTALARHRRQPTTTLTQLRLVLSLSLSRCQARLRSAASLAELGLSLEPTVFADIVGGSPPTRCEHEQRVHTRTEEEEERERGGGRVSPQLCLLHTSCRDLLVGSWLSMVGHVLCVCASALLCSYQVLY